MRGDQDRTSLALNRLRDFPGTRPFDEANAWLASRGLSPSTGRSVDAVKRSL